jgi:hypothetical protein
MARDPLDALRLSLMQDVLPVGLAAVDRVRRGGPQELIAAFASEGNEDPLAQLRQEGEEAATAVRDQLDRVSPGLGNPVLKVEVHDVPPEPVTVGQPQPLEQPLQPDQTELQRHLAAIDARLQELERRLCPDPVAP